MSTRTTVKLTCCDGGGELEVSWSCFFSLYFFLIVLGLLRYKYLLEEIQCKYANNKHIFISMDLLSFSNSGYMVFLV